MKTQHQKIYDYMYNVGGITPKELRSLRGCRCPNRGKEKKMKNKEAVNWIINLSADIGKSEHSELWHYEQALYEIREILESAQPGWIPVTERLPEDYGTYICTCFDGCANRVTFVKWQNKLKQWILNGSRSYWKVVAWMPLPEPFKGGE